MNIRDCEIFIHLSECKSSSRTALHFQLSQPAIIKIISNIEHQLGKELFYKGIQQRKRNFELTQAGIIYKRFCESVIAQHFQCIQQLDELNGYKNEQLRIGIPPLGASIIGKYLVNLKLKFPHIKLNFTETSAAQIETQLLAKELDLGFLPYETHAPFLQREIYRSDIYALYRSSQRETEEQHLSMQDVSKKTLILLKDAENFNQIVLKGLAERGMSPEICCKTSQLDFLFSMVESGVAYTILPKPYTQFQHRQFKTLSLFPFLQWKLNMTWLEDNQNPVVSSWLNVVRL